MPKRGPIKFAVYNLTTREVVRERMTTWSILNVDLQCTEGQGWLFGWHPIGTIVTDELIAAAEAAEAEGGI